MDGHPWTNGGPTNIPRRTKVYGSTSLDERPWTNEGPTNILGWTKVRGQMKIGDAMLEVTTP
jgi:hypothetical protein